MSVNLTTNAVKKFDRMVKHAYQDSGKLKNTVTVRTGVVGSSYQFPKMGESIASLHIPQEDVKPMNVAHSNVVCTVSDYTAAEYTSIFDQAEVNYSEQEALAKSIGWALGRKVDQIIIDTMNAGSATTSIAVGVGGNNKMNIGKLRKAAEIFDDLSIDTETRHFALSAAAKRQLLETTEVTSSDFNTVKALVNGEINSYMGFTFHTIGSRTEGGLPGTSPANITFAWVPSGIGYVENISEQIGHDWMEIKQSRLIVGKLKAGACVIENQGFIDITYDSAL